MTHDDLCRVIAGALSPDRFFAGAAAKVRLFERPREPTRFEVFRGHLLAPQQTRQKRELESFDVVIDRPGASAADAAPVVSVKLDAGQRAIYVTRCLLTRQWEPYEEEPNVILTRQREGPMCELVGRVDVARISTAESLGRELRELVFQAIVGTSRLPITSLESPLPDYSLGRLAYLPAVDIHVANSVADGIDVLMRHAAAAELTVRQQTKLVEAALRAADGEDVPRLGDLLFEQCRASTGAENRADEILRRIFNDAALSPYTRFADNFVALLLHLATPERLGPSAVIDTIGYMLRQIVRHLTAFDLVTFHNQGANYPDALLLDSLLREYLALADRHPQQFVSAAGGRNSRSDLLRRRALRGAWIVRKWYENHPVPDRPTSPGDQERVLPEPFRPVPEEQLTGLSKRRRRLFADVSAEDLLTPPAREIFEKSISDLSRSAELRELGMSLFLDRPLGVFKPPGAVDRTPLLSYEAFSRQIACRRLDALLRWGVLTDVARHEDHVRHLEAFASEGYPAAQLPGAQRGAVVALEDARKAAIDFRFLRTTRSSLDELLSGYDLGPLRHASPKLADWLEHEPHLLWIRTRPETAAERTAQCGRQRFLLLDRAMRPRIELEPLIAKDSLVHYVESAGVEMLEEGLTVTAVWEDDAKPDKPTPRRFKDGAIRLLPRVG